MFSNLALLASGSLKFFPACQAKSHKINMYKYILRHTIPYNLISRARSGILFSSSIRPIVSFSMSARFVQATPNPMAKITDAWFPIPTPESPFCIFDSVSRLIPARSATQSNGFKFEHHNNRVQFAAIQQIQRSRNEVRENRKLFDLEDFIWCVGSDCPLLLQKYSTACTLTSKKQLKSTLKEYTTPRTRKKCYRINWSTSGL